MNRDAQRARTIETRLAQSREIIHAKDKEISNLNVRIQDVHGKLEILQRQRPKLSPQTRLFPLATPWPRCRKALIPAKGG